GNFKFSAHVSHHLGYWVRKSCTVLLELAPRTILIYSLEVAGGPTTPLKRQSGIGWRGRQTNKNRNGFGYAAKQVIPINVPKDYSFSSDGFRTSYLDVSERTNKSIG
ncbi:unnamed protein product, partial [Pylaiella littoralis]